MSKANMKKPPFLTVYTVIQTDDSLEKPTTTETIGSWVRRGDAIKACADHIMERMRLNSNFRSAVYNDDENPDLRTELERVAPADFVKSFFEDYNEKIWRSKVSPWETSKHAKAIAKVLVKYIEDELGGTGGYHIYRGDGYDETYNFDIMENDVEGVLETFACVTSGKTDNEDTEFEDPFPEVFLSEKEAVDSALKDLKYYLNYPDKGDPKYVNEVMAEARANIRKYGKFCYQIHDGAMRQWDIYRTPIVLSGELPKASLVRRIVNAKKS